MATTRTWASNLLLYTDMATPEVMHDLRLYHFKQFARIGIYAMLPRWRAPLAWLRPVSSPGILRVDLPRRCASGL
jgi:hypothetical protein